MHVKINRYTVLSTVKSPFTQTETTSISFDKIKEIV